MVIPHCHIMEAIERILQSGYQLGRHEQETVHGVGPLASGRNHHIRCAAIGIGVHIRPVIALASGVLGCGEERQMVAAVAQPEVVCGLAGMYVMVGLLGNHGHMGRHVEAVAAAAVFMGVVVFHGELADVGGAEKASRAQGLGLQLRHLGEAVAVMVVSVAVAALAVDEQTGQAVVGHHRGV